MYSSRVACRRQEEALRQYFHWQAALGEGTALGRRAMSLIGTLETCCDVGSLVAIGGRRTSHPFGTQSVIRPRPAFEVAINLSKALGRR